MTSNDMIERDVVQKKKERITMNSQILSQLEHALQELDGLDELSMEDFYNEIEEYEENEIDTESIFVVKTDFSAMGGSRPRRAD